MRYTVTWVPNAERDLASIWLNASDRNAVSEAATEIDRSLRASPDVQGESRDGDFRILIVSPLGIRFRVLQNEALVQVLSVWRFRTRGE